MLRFFNALQRRMDMLMPSRWQYVSGTVLGGVGYAISGLSQGDSAPVLAAESAAGLVVGPLVVAGIRYLGRDR